MSVTGPGPYPDGVTRQWNAPTGYREEPVDAGPPVRPAKKKGWRCVLAIALVAAVLALARGGFVAGWYAKDLVQASRVAEGPEIIEIPAADAVVEQPMLDLRGMTLADAKQALAETGIPVGGLKVVEVP